MKITKILPPDDATLNATPTANARSSKAYSTIQWSLLVLAFVLVLGLTPWFLGIGWM